MACSLLEFAPVLGKMGRKKNEKPTIISLFIHLLNEQDSVVRLTLLSNLKHLVLVVDIEDLTKNYLLSVIESLLNHADWKVRIEVPQHFVFLTQNVVDLA